MMTLWIPFSWFNKIFIGLIVDVFLHQITTSKQICMDMMLQPNLEGMLLLLGYFILPPYFNI